MNPGGPGSISIKLYHFSTKNQLKNELWRYRLDFRRGANTSKHVGSSTNMSSALDLVSTLTTHLGLASIYPLRGQSLGPLKSQGKALLGTCFLIGVGCRDLDPAVAAAAAAAAAPAPAAAAALKNIKQQTTYDWRTMFVC